MKSILFDWLKKGLYQELDKYEVFIYLLFTYIFTRLLFIVIYFKEACFVF